MFWFLLVCGPCSKMGTSNSPISSAHLGTVLALLWQQAFEFIRAELRYHVEIIPIFGHNKQIRHYRVRINDSTRFEFGIIKTYEVARESALDFILSKLD